MNRLPTIPTRRTPCAIARLTAYLDTRPPDLGQVIDHAETLIRAHYDVALLNLKLPIRERRPMAVVRDKTLGGDLFAFLVVNTDQITDKYDRNEAMLRMLGVHAAIRGYGGNITFCPPRSPNCTWAN